MKFNPKDATLEYSLTLRYRGLANAPLSSIPSPKGRRYANGLVQSLMCETPCSRAASPKSKIELPNAQCPMPNAQCPMPNAQCPMPNAQCPMPN
ncbi:MAG: hypothetical protein V7L04_04620, partial [Nostoc sp.]